MNGISIALPRVRRRRRKPPHPQFWWTLANLVWTVGFAIFDIALIATGSTQHPALIGAAAGFQIAMAVFWWPLFLRELRKWRDDEGSES